MVPFIPARIGVLAPPVITAIFNDQPDIADEEVTIYARAAPDG